MAMFEFWLSDEDTDRVFSLKQAAGKDKLTANEYARELLERELHRLHPQQVKFDDNGEMLN